MLRRANRTSVSRGAWMSQGEGVRVLLVTRRGLKFTLAIGHGERVWFSSSSRIKSSDARGFLAWPLAARYNRSLFWGTSARVFRPLNDCKNLWAARKR